MNIPVELLSNRHVCPALHVTEDLLFYVVEHRFCSVAKLCPVIATPWTVAGQPCLSSTISQRLHKLMFIESVMSYNHFILCLPLLLLPSIFPSIGVFSSESDLHIRWPTYWSFSNSPSNEYSGLIFLYNWLVWSPCCPRDSQESSPAPQVKSIILQMLVKHITVQIPRPQLWLFKELSD